MDSLKSVLKGAMIFALYIIVFSVGVILSEILFYDIDAWICLYISIGLCIVLPSLYYFIERKIKVEALEYNTAFFVLMALFLLFVAPYYLNENSDAFYAFYDKIHPNDEAWLAGIQFAFYFIFYVGAMILTLIVRIIIAAVKKHKIKNDDKKEIHHVDK